MANRSRDAANAGQCPGPSLAGRAHPPVDDRFDLNAEPLAATDGPRLADAGRPARQGNAGGTGTSCPFGRLAPLRRSPPFDGALERAEFGWALRLTPPCGPSGSPQDHQTRSARWKHSRSSSHVRAADGRGAGRSQPASQCAPHMAPRAVAPHQDHTRLLHRQTSVFSAGSSPSSTGKVCGRTTPLFRWGLAREQRRSPSLLVRDQETRANHPRCKTRHHVPRQPTNLGHRRSPGSQGAMRSTTAEAGGAVSMTAPPASRSRSDQSIFGSNVSKDALASP